MHLYKSAIFITLGVILYKTNKILNLIEKNNNNIQILTSSVDKLLSSLNINLDQSLDLTSIHDSENNVNSDTINKLIDSVNDLKEKTEELTNKVNNSFVF